MEGASRDVMSVQSTSFKAIALLLIVLAAAFAIWTNFAPTEPVEKGTIPQGGAILIPLMIGASLLGLVIAVVTCFAPTWAMITGPLYSACQGVVLGTLSVILEPVYPGITLQAVALTSAVFLIMFGLYATRIIRVTDWLTRAIIGATGAIFLVYMASWILGLFGIQIPWIHDSGPIGIIFSIIVVGIAAFNLLLDFDVIEKGASRGLPKSMEWYAAFGLMVTLIWLYIEILNLLIKLRSSQD